MPDNILRFAASLIAEHRSRLTRFLSARLRSVHDAEDLAQEVFLRLTRIPNRETIENPQAYLFTIAGHVVHQHTLKRSNAGVAVDIADLGNELQAPEYENPVARAEEAQRLEQLQRLFQDKNPRLLATLLLHKQHGYSLEEIGREFGVARETAKKYLAQAITHCRLNLPTGRDTP